MCAATTVIGRCMKYIALRFQGWYDPEGKKNWDQDLK